MEFEQQTINRPGVPFLGGGQTRKTRALVAADADVDGRSVATLGRHFRPDPNGPLLRREQHPQCPQGNSGPEARGDDGFSPRQDPAPALADDAGHDRQDLVRFPGH
jgi:hypothetical protein